MNAILRKFAPLALLVTLLALPACGDKDGTKKEGNKKESKKDSSKDNDLSDASIAFVTNQIADFWKIAEAGCKDAEAALGIKVIVKMPPKATATEQKRIIEDLLNSGVKGIAISPLDADNQVGFLDSVADKVHLITHDSDAPKSKRKAYIGMDNYKAGRMCGELVKQALPNGGNIMLFIGRLEQDNSKFRRQGVIDELLGGERANRNQAYYTSRTNAWDPNTGPITGNNYTILGTITDQGSRTTSKNKAADAITANPNLNAMVGLFEYNPPAIYEALKQAEKLGKIQIIGFDENDLTLQAIKEGNCIGTIVQNPYEYGYQSAVVLKDLIMGKKIESYIDIAPRKITKANVDKFASKLKALKTPKD